MDVTVVLADGFAGERVEVSASGRIRTIGPARTSLLTGTAGDLVFDVDTGHPRGGRVHDAAEPIDVAVRLLRAEAPAPGRPAPREAPRPPHDDARATGAETPWTTYRVAQGDVLVVDLIDGRLHGRVMPGPVGFA